MLAPFVVGADTNLNGANAGPTPGLAPTPPSVTLVWQRHSQTDRAVNKSMRQMLSDEHHHLHRRRRLGSLSLALRHHGGLNLPPRRDVDRRGMHHWRLGVGAAIEAREPVGVAHPMTSRGQAKQLRIASAYPRTSIRAKTTASSGARSTSIPGTLGSTWTPRRFNCAPHCFKIEIPPGEEFLLL